MPTTELTLRTVRTILRPVTAEDAATLAAIRRSREVSRWWHAPDAGFPMADAAFPTDTLFAIELSGAHDIGPDGAVIGMIQACEGDDPEYALAAIDVFLAGSVHRRGLGREVVAAILRWLVEVRGHHRVTIDPALDNVAAIACYRACGFVPVGVLHQYERDTDGRGWHDNLLMEYVAPA
ncbi:MAG TPA: GNAT family protein [Candidatus Nanopelagicales bacterium]